LRRYNIMTEGENCIMTEGEKCVICMEEIQENLFKLPECQHGFHSNCIIHWFRQGNSSCPLCNNIGSGMTSYSQNRWHRSMRGHEIYSHYKRASKKKGAPKSLVDEIKAITKLEFNQKVRVNKFKKFKAMELDMNGEKLTVRELFRKYSNHRSSTYINHRKLLRRKQFIDANLNIKSIILVERKIIE
jgi:hypothetical protein